MKYSKAIQIEILKNSRTQNCYCEICTCENCTCGSNDGTISTKLKNIAFGLYVMALLIMVPIVSFLEIDHNSAISAKNVNISTPLSERVALSESTSTSFLGNPFITKNF